MQCYAMVDALPKEGRTAEALSLGLMPYLRKVGQRKHFLMRGDLVLSKRTYIYMDFYMDLLFQSVEMRFSISMSHYFYERIRMRVE